MSHFHCRTQHIPTTSVRVTTVLIDLLRPQLAAVSAADNEEDAYLHIEKTVICAIAKKAMRLSFRCLTCYRQTAWRVHDVTAALAPWRERKPYNPPLPPCAGRRRKNRRGTMARVTVEDCLERVNNHFALCILAAERARQLAGGARPTVVCTNKSAVTALREIGGGKVSFKENVDETVRTFLADRKQIDGAARTAAQRKRLG